jgi:hypothetical protein
MDMDDEERVIPHCFATFIKLIPNSLKRLRQQLRDNITDASREEMFRGMYEGYQFPEDDANPLEGFGKSDLFVNVSRTPCV